MTTDLQPVATADPKRGEAAKAATDLRGHGQGNGMPVWGHDWCADFVEMVWAQEQWDTSGLDDGAASFQEGYLARHPDAMHDKPQVGDAVVYGYMLGLQHRADRVHVSQPYRDHRRPSRHRRQKGVTASPRAAVATLRHGAAGVQCSSPSIFPRKSSASSGCKLHAPSSIPGLITLAASERRERGFSASCDGFDVYCAVRIAADDDQGRERLVRYCVRPAFALSRIELLADGRIAYLLKTPRRGRTHRIMSPMEFMARLAALIAPPRIPLVRYHGVFAPRSSWRPLVTPKPPACAPSPKACATSAPASTPAPAPASPAPASPAPASPARTKELAPARTEAHAEPVVLVDATMITVAHWGV